MSTSPELEGIVALPVATELPAPEAPVQEPPATEPVSEPAARAGRRRPAWIVPTAIGAVALIVAGTLGFLLYSTIQQRDTLHTQLVSTRSTLASTQDQLTAAQADAKEKKVTADYVALYIADEGKVLTDYENSVGCTGYSECRTDAQQFLNDLQQFQQDRKSASVPFALENQDSALGDAISAAIAGDQEFISGMDNDDTSKAEDGGKKIDAAMLNLAKAEAAMGTAIK
jgi:hypothetical protein